MMPSPLPLLPSPLLPPPLMMPSPYHYLLLLFLLQLCDSVAAVTGHLALDGEYYIFCNERFNKTFATCDDMYDKVKKYGCLPTLLWSW